MYTDSSINSRSSCLNTTWYSSTLQTRGWLLGATSTPSSEARRATWPPSTSSQCCTWCSVSHHDSDPFVVEQTRLPILVAFGQISVKTCSYNCLCVCMINIVQQHNSTVLIVQSTKRSAKLVADNYDTTTLLSYFEVWYYYPTSAIEF